MKRFNDNKGIGLIEILITALVIGVGMLAIASLQGTLVKTSGDNKVRSDALQFANLKMEQLRDQILKTGYETIATGHDTNPLTGSSETFYRYWTVTNLPYSSTTTTPVDCTVTSNKPDDCFKPTRKRVEVTVAWGKTGYDKCTADSASGCSSLASTLTGSSADQQVNIQSVITYDNVAMTNIIGDGNTTGSAGGITSPSTNAGSSTVISDDRNVALNTPGTGGTLSTQTTDTPGQYLKINADGTSASVVYKCTGETATDVIPFIPFENELYTRRVHFLPSSTTFKESIELAQSNNDNLFGTGQHSCTRKVRYNGGVIIPIKGRIYSNVDVSSIVSLLGFDASESGVFCKFTPTGLSTTVSVPYYCYVGGNCVNGPVGTKLESTSGLAAAIAANATASAGQNTIVTQCPALPTGTFTGSPVYQANVYANVGPGGWRGNVGVIGLAKTQASQTLTTCLTPAATARQYYTKRTNGSEVTNEGINRPYMCHDFLVVNPPNGSGTTPDCSPQGALNIAASPTIYNISGTTVNSYSETVNSGNCHVITGSVPTGITKVGVASTFNAGFDCSMTDSTHYKCIGTSKDTSITIAATAGGTASCSRTLSSSSMSLNCDLTLPSVNYTISGTISGSDTARANVIIAIDGTTCSKSPTSGSASSKYLNYSCSITKTPPATVAVTVTNGTASSNSISLSSSPTTVTGPTISAGACQYSGTTINDGSSITAYSTNATVAYPASCSTTVSCSGGTLSGALSSYTSLTPTSCVAQCTVPNINGLTSSSAATSTLSAAGLSGNKTVITTGTSGQVSGQNPAYNTVVTCGSTVSYNYTAYNITGTVSWGTVGATPVTVTLPTGCSPTSVTASGTSYTCAELGGSITLTAAVNNAGTTSTKNKICIGTASTGTTATSTIFIGTISSNLTKYIKIVKGTAVCP